MEIEAKYAITGSVSPDDIGKLDLAPYQLERAADHDLHDTPMDTPERALAANHSSLRVRRDGDKTLITFKHAGGSDANGVHRREEIERDLMAGTETDVAHWPVEIATRYREIAGDAAPAPLFAINNNRRTWRVQRADGTEVAEVALDEGTFEVNGKTQPLHEIEIELKGAGTEDDLSQIAPKFVAALPIQPETRSKMQRGLVFLDEQSAPTKRRKAAKTVSTTATALRDTPPATNGHSPNGHSFADSTILPVISGAVSTTAITTLTDVPLDPSESIIEIISQNVAESKKRAKKEKQKAEQTGTPMTATAPLAEAGRTVLKKHLESLLKAEPVAREGSDPEGVHNMRVAMRRLRAALSVLETTVYDPRVSRRFRRGLRDLAGALGVVRDSDVFLIHVDKYIQTLPDETCDGLKPLRAWIEQNRDAGRQAMLQTLENKATRRLLKDLEKFVNTPGAGVHLREVGQDEIAPSLVRHYAGSALLEQYENVIAYETAMPAPIQTLHRLRVAGKHFRYTLEFFKDALGGDVDGVIGQVTEVQDVLGELHDDDVAMTTIDLILSQHAAKGKSKKSKKHALTAAELDALHQYRAARQTHQSDGTASFAVKRWPMISGATFRQQLTALVSRL